MMKKVVLFFLFVMCWMPLVLSQNHTQYDSLYMPKLTGESFVEKIYKGVNQFITPEWINSTILRCTGDTIVGERIKYNGFLDEVIWLNPSNYKKFKLDKINISEFWIQPSGFIPTHYKKISVPITQDNS
jgi:hypothetical protein